MESAGQWWTGGVVVVGRWLRGGERETERERYGGGGTAVRKRE